MILGCWLLVDFGCKVFDNWFGGENVVDIWAGIAEILLGLGGLPSASHVSIVADSDSAA